MLVLQWFLLQISNYFLAAQEQGKERMDKVVANDDLRKLTDGIKYSASVRDLLKIAFEVGAFASSTLHTPSCPFNFAYRQQRLELLLSAPIHPHLFPLVTTTATFYLTLLTSGVHSPFFLQHSLCAHVWMLTSSCTHAVHGDAHTTTHTDLTFS